MIFTGFFCIEMAMKLFALQFFEYLCDAFNIFDAVVVMISVVEIALEVGSKPAWQCQHAVPGVTCATLVGHRPWQSQHLLADACGATCCWSCPVCQKLLIPVCCPCCCPGQHCHTVTCCRGAEAARCQMMQAPHPIWMMHFCQPLPLDLATPVPADVRVWKQLTVRSARASRLQSPAPVQALPLRQGEPPCLTPYVSGGCSTLSMMSAQAHSW